MKKLYIQGRVYFDVETEIEVPDNFDEKEIDFFTIFEKIKEDKGWDDYLKRMVLDKSEMTITRVDTKGKNIYLED